MRALHTGLCNAVVLGLGLAAGAARADTDLRSALDGDPAALFYFVGPLPAASAEVSSDTHVVTATDPRQPEAVKRWTVRNTLRLRGVNHGSTAFPAPYTQLLWISQGKVYRMRLDGGLAAPVSRVSGLSQVCDIFPTDPGRREDAWVMASLADRRGRCPADGEAVGLTLFRTDAGPADQGLMLGHSPDVRVLGTLHRTNGGAGPLLVHHRRTGRLEVVDADEVDPQRPQEPVVRELMVASDRLPLQFDQVPALSPQVGVLQANGQVMLLDWRQGPARVVPVPLPAQSGGQPWMVTGPWGGRYVLAQGTALVSIDLEGQVSWLAALPTPTEGPHAGQPLGMQLHQHGCMLAVQTAPGAGPPALPVALNQLLLNPQLRTVQPLDLRSYAGLRMRPQQSVVMWRPLGDKQGLQAMTRIDCDSGRSDTMLMSALELPAFPWFGPQGQQRIRPALEPANPSQFPHISLPTGVQRVLTGSLLRTYNEDRGRWLHHGTLPQVGEMHIISLVPSAVQVSTSVWLFEALLADADGRRWLTGLLVSATHDGPVTVGLKPLPWPAP